MLFRLEQKNKPEKEVLGYPWLEVLAIQPFAITERNPEYLGDWATQEIRSWWFCRTPQGITRILDSDVLMDEGEGGEYEFPKVGLPTVVSAREYRRLQFQEVEDAVLPGTYTKGLTYEGVA